MGILRFGPPEALVLGAKSRFGIDTFVETGTFKGDTIAWAARHFARVLTVELSEPIFNETAARYGHLRNVEFTLGDSAAFLAKVVAEFDRPAVFWLDAHWCGGAPTAGSPASPCPLLAEIAAVNRSRHDNFVLVDDARYFVRPAPAPHDPAAWPSLWEVMAALHQGAPRYSIITEDVIAAAPLAAKPLLVEYCRARPDFERDPTTL